MMRRSLVSALLLLQLQGHCRAQPYDLPPGPDPRLDVDVLLVVAHPDDETAVGGVLSKLVADDRRRVAVVYCTRGTGGGNNAGQEQSRSMGAIREMEARTALSTLGISLLWFIDGQDTPGQNVLASLGAWGHGNVLEQLCRLVRLTKPEVVITWLPRVVAGENHGDHQAAGVITTEAFDLSADPSVFPVQVAAPREPEDINNVGEGLQPWQAQKLYYFSDASHTVQGDGPRFDINAVSEARGVPFTHLAAGLMIPHKTQGGVSSPAEAAVASGDFTELTEWLSRYRLLYGKSVVPCSRSGDLFEGVSDTPVPYVPMPGYVNVPQRGVSVRLGGAFGFFSEFWKAHGIEHVAEMAPTEIEVSGGTYLDIPLVISNGAGSSVTVCLQPELPPGYRYVAGRGPFQVGPGQEVTVRTFQWCPSEATPPSSLRWVASSEGREIGSVMVTVSTVPWALPW